MSGIDYQNRVGHKMGQGGPASAQEMAIDRKERLRRLALETVDLSKDPYSIYSIFVKFCQKITIGAFNHYTIGAIDRKERPRRLAVNRGFVQGSVFFLFNFC